MFYSPSIYANFSYFCLIDLWQQTVMSLLHYYTMLQYNTLQITVCDIPLYHILLYTRFFFLASVSSVMTKTTMSLLRVYQKTKETLLRGMPIELKVITHNDDFWKEVKWGSWGGVEGGGEKVRRRSSDASIIIFANLQEIYEVPMTLFINSLMYKIK